MKDDRDYKVDLSAAASPGGAAASADSAANSARSPAPGHPAARPFVSVHFACCNVYLRIYRSPDGLAYRGRCPKCAKPVNFPIGQGGTHVRTFRVE